MQGWLEPDDGLDARRFAIAIRRLADALAFGTDRSPFLGSGVEYVQSRPYVMGDSVRTIDWRVTARTRVPHVKEYEAPKRMPCLLLVDGSASMTIGSGRRTKYAVAVQLAGGLALACLDRSSPVGVVGVGGEELRIVPSLSKDRILQWMHHLRHHRFDEPTTLAERLDRLVPSLKERHLLIVISDLHDLNAVGSLRAAVQRHDVAVLQTIDPAELGLQGAGFFEAFEAETGRRFVARGRDVGTDPEVTSRELRRSGIDHLMIPIDQPFAMNLRRFFRYRGQLGRGAR